MDKIAESYKHLSAMRTETITAFEHRENKQDDSKLMELLNKWRSFSFSEPFIDNDVIVKREQLNSFEGELFRAYSPAEITKSRICDISFNVRKYLLQLSNENIINQDDALLISRLLCNCQLMMDCFFPIHETQYENHISNVLSRLNQCIVISHSDYFSEYFSHILLNFNDEFASVKEASAHIFHIIGVLNFKCHNYDKAIEFFKEAITRFENEPNIYQNDEYFQTRLLLAYCYEYDHQFESAIEELIGLDVSTIIEIFKRSSFNIFDLLDDSDKDRAKVWSERFISDVLKNKIMEKGPDSLFIVADKRDITNRKNVGDRHEILHSFAHCLNELGIKWRIESGKSKDNVIHLLALSRAIMLYVAEYDTDCMDFQTCMYMIFGEAKDYDICIARISQLVDAYGASSQKNVNYEMENMFYLFLVSNQSNKTIYDDKQKERAEAAYKKFVGFAQRRYDYDALIHIEIIKFRFEIINILRSSVMNEEIATRLKELKESSVGENIFTIKPSTKLNQWIIQEYNKTIALYEFLSQYFSANEDVNINELYNFASRFNFYRNFFSRGKLKQNTDKLQTISNVIDLIVDDFISPQSIFLLAPLTTAIPYQHQMENLSRLEDSLYSIEKMQIDPNEKMYNFEDLNEIGPDTTDVTNIKWLFSHREYDVAFVAYKWNSEISFDRYRFCISDANVYERPIINVSKVNGLIGNVRRANKIHSYCRNGQQSCCTTVITGTNEKTIKSLCAELMIPLEKYRDKHFVYFFRGKTAKNNNQSWYVIAMNSELCPLQVEEITFKLCGHNFPPRIRLALSHNDFCYISYGIADVAVVKNDLIKLQEEHRVRFWINNGLMENEHWNDSVFNCMDMAKCIVFFISVDRLKREATETCRELLYAYDHKLRCIVVLIGFSQKKDFINAVKDSISGKEKSDDVLALLFDTATTYVFRNQRGFDFEEHLSENGILLSELKKFGVVRNEQ